MIYNRNWDLVTRLYEEKQSSSEKKDGNIIAISTNSKHIKADEMFHGVMELRKRLKQGNMISDMYGKYPELLQNVTLEDLIFRGMDLKFTDESSQKEFIPSVDPLLFNSFYYMICPEKDAKIFEDNFDPTWGTAYVEGYSKKIVLCTQEL